MAAKTWVPGVAAAAVVLVIGAGVVLARSGGDPDPAAAAPASTARFADLLVRDGDLVEMSGQVQAVPGRPVRFCSPVAVAGIGYPPGQEPAPPYCTTGVTLLGADLSRLSRPSTVKGVRLGYARIEGRYRAGTVTVTRQAPPDADRPAPAGAPEHPPCPAPAGGWSAEAPQGHDEAVTSYVAAHRDRFTETWIGWPDGYPKNYTGTGPLPKQVLVVGTTGDVAAARRELTGKYAGNLCVVPARYAYAEVAAVYAAAMPPRPGVYSYSQGVETVRIDLVIVDPATLTWLRRLDGSNGIVVPTPDVRPLRS